MGVAQLAAERDGELGARRVMSVAAARDGAGDPEVPLTVRHLGDLGEDTARGGERLVHRPQRAGAAEPREVEVGGGLPLGDIAGAVDPQERERHA